MRAAITDRPSQAERVKALTDRLEQGVKDLFESGRYAAYLNAMSKFHSYSANNLLLILLQCPHASQVAGYTTWKKDFGRNVKRGEKGIQILAPCPYKILTKRDKLDPNTNCPVLDANGEPVSEWVLMKRQSFKIVTVFDVSQTEGRELPRLGVEELTGTVAYYQALSGAIEDLSPVPIHYKAPVSPSAKGCYSHLAQCVYVRPGMSQVQTIKTLLHEVAHAKLHALPVENGVITELPEKNRRTREVEAESVAYVVCQHFGIDTSDYSFGYVAGWSRGRELEELRTSLECIRATAAELIDGIESRCPELFPKQPQRESKNRKPSLER